VPERAMETGEFVALLATATLPVTLPAPDGLNVTAKVAVCPGVKMSPLETPLALKPAPEKLTPETVTFEFPALVRVTLWVALLDTFTLPKAKLDALELRSNVPVVTVSVAEVLVALPTLLVTSTANCALLSEATSAEVVYEEAVAPPIAIAFFIHWYVIGAVPAAITVNVAVCPAVTVLLEGCVVIVGATAAPVPGTKTTSRK